jgi:hypothetical protein
MEVLQFPEGDISTVGPHWHPDGQKLLVQRLFGDRKLSLWWIAADGSSAEELKSEHPPYNNSEGRPISPDGGKVAGRRGTVAGSYTRPTRTGPASSGEFPQAGGSRSR